MGWDWLLAGAPWVGLHASQEKQRTVFCVCGGVDEGGARLCSYLMHVGAEEYFT